MRQRVRLQVAGANLYTTCTDAEAVRLKETLAACWSSGLGCMVTILDDSPSALPMHVNALLVQAMVCEPVD